MAEIENGGKVIFGRGAEKWKNIIFPKQYKTTQAYQVSNYGRVRNFKEEDVFRIKKPILYQGQLLYRFSFPPSKNNGKKLCLHVPAKKLVCSHFNKEYKKGKYIVWKDYNKLNNYVTNLLVLDPSPGRSHAAKGRNTKVAQIPVMPPVLTEKAKDKSPHKVEAQYDYFKPIPNFSLYEINRFGVIKRRRPPFKGRILKQRIHPDKFYFIDLTNDHKQRKTVYTHKAVAETWNINVLPERRTIVIHKDGNTLNNCSDNLEWVDHSEALKYQFEHKQRDNRKSWRTRKKRYGKSGQKRKTLKEEHY
ncbi:MAG: NUMOD4 domain-containing protein [Candidatus Cyclobacteriaceae bacterium M2_1C_046]